jgi:hypothetical protein
LFRIESKSANKRQGDHERESDLFHGITPLLFRVLEGLPEKLFDRH